MLLPVTHAASDPQPLPVQAAGRKRRKPNEAEQARRVAWGHKWGPLMAESIKTAIREAQ